MGIQEWMCVKDLESARSTGQWSLDFGDYLEFFVPWHELSCGIAGPPSGETGATSQATQDQCAGAQKKGKQILKTWGERASRSGLR